MADLHGLCEPWRDGGLGENQLRDVAGCGGVEWIAATPSRGGGAVGHCVGVVGVGAQIVAE